MTLAQALLIAVFTAGLVEFLHLFRTWTRDEARRLDDFLRAMEARDRLRRIGELEREAFIRRRPSA